MKVTALTSDSHVVEVMIKATPEEYNILLQAMLLLSWACISTDPDITKRTLIENVKRDMEKINI